VRPGWVSRLGPWIGIGTSPAALMLGGGLGQDLDGCWLASSAAIGIVALTLLATAQGALGQRRGTNISGVLAGPLGRLGARHVASWVIVAMMLGWFGVNAGVGGTALGRLLGASDAAGIALFALIVLAVVWRGLGTLSWVALAAGLATVGIGAYGVILALRDTGARAAETGGGDLPAALAGATLVVGYGAAFALRSPDFTLDLARGRHVLWCAVAGLSAPLLIFVAAGAALQRATGTWNLAEVLVELDAARVAQLFLAVGFTGSVMTNLHSGAAALIDGSPTNSRAAALVLIGAGGSALALAGLADRMLGYLELMAVLAPGLVVLSVLYWTSGSVTRDKWGIPALMAWALGFVAGVGLGLAGSPLALPGALALTGGAYFTITAVLGRRGQPWETNDEHCP